MLKKIYIAITLSCLSMMAFGASLDELKAQFVHLQAQVKAVKLSWQRAELTLRQAQKLNFVLYHQTQADAKDILARGDIVTKMDELVTQQVDSIVNGKMPYKAINFLADSFPELVAQMKSYLRLVSTAMANREFRSLLGKKLVLKMNELMIAIKEAKLREEAE